MDCIIEKNVMIYCRSNGFLTGECKFIKKRAEEPIEFDNLKIIDYTAGQGNSSSFAEITVPAGIRHRLSWSDRSDKYYYVVRGNVNFIVNDESSNLSSGDVCIILKGDRFSYRNTSSEEAVLILVHTPCFKPESEEFEE